MNLISIDDMTPAPTDEEAAAIGAALEILWPKPKTLDSVPDVVAMEIQRVDGGMKQVLGRSETIKFAVQLMLKLCLNLDTGLTR